MSDFNEKMIQRLKRLEREVERLQRWERPVVITDHGSLTGLGDNDHPQYLLTTGKAADSDKLDGIDSTGFATATHDHTGVYLPIAGKAADSNKLDGYDSADFGRPVFLTTPKTSTSWDGDARSTTAKTLIDLSSVFGVPAGVKAILARLAARDSGSYANSGLYFSLSPSDAAGGAAILRPAGIVNDVYTDGMFIVPCDANGDVYYQIVASGTGTLDAILQVWGYWL